MKKRPLCFICIVLILMMWILQASKGADLSEACELKNVTVYGKIYQCEYKDEKQILYLKQTVLSESSQSKKINNIRITCSDTMQKYMTADVVRVKGNLKSLEPPTNWGQFDVRSYYSAQKVEYTMWKPEIQLLERPKLSLARGLSRLREILADQYEQLLPNQYGALLKGITLGEKNDISEEIKELFQTGGISHILAISALHLQILGSGLYKILRKCRISIGVAAVIAGIFLTGYGILTGASVATLRALIMFLVNIGGDVSGRTYDGPTGMALAGVLLTAGNPSYLSYSGFWLSFGAVCSFMIFKERKRLSGGILLYCFMAPIMLNYFYELSLYSILVNLFVVPTAVVVLTSGLLGCAVSFVSVVLGQIVSVPSVVLLYIYKKLCEICTRLPLNTVAFGHPSWMQMIIYYGLMMLTLYLFRKYRLKKRRAFVLLIMIPAFMILTNRNVSGIQITMLDIGQGDAIVIETESKHVYMIDGGSSSEESIGKYKILPYLEYSGISELEAVFISHADSDHINGILELLDMISEKKTYLKINKIVLPDWSDMSPFQQIYEKANENDIEIFRFEKGGEMTDGEMTMTCLGPDGGNYRNRTNEGSMILRMEYRNFSILFTGDLEGSAESELIKCCGDVDVLKVAHHGSENSTSEAFLKEVQPEISIISAGAGNAYGHPHQELLQRLENYDSVIFDTITYGALIIRSDGEKIDLKTYKQYNEP